jgi:hypothetical protein
LRTSNPIDNDVIIRDIKLYVLIVEEDIKLAGGNELIAKTVETPVLLSNNLRMELDCTFSPF